MNKIAVQLENAINKEMPGFDAPDHNKYLAMKGYTYFMRGCRMDCRTEHNYNFLEKTVRLLEPIKLQPEVVYQYVNVLTTLGQSYCERSQYQKAIEYLEKAEQTYEEFKAKVTDVETDAMTEYQIFGVTHDINLQRSLTYAHHMTMIHLYICYNALKSDEMKLKYVLPCIKGKLRINIVENDIAEVQKLVPDFSDEPSFLITSHYFAQVNHLLSVLMFHLVKYRRSLPHEKQHEVSNAQAFVSELYGFWACELVQYSLLSLKDKTYCEKHPINNEVVRFEELMEPGVEIYENQFPCEPILTRNELNKVVKKGKAWCQRAIVLYGHEKCSTAEMVMETLIDFEPMIQLFKGK